MTGTVTELASGAAADGPEVSQARTELFDAAFYVLANSDLAITEPVALQHYWTRGRYEGRAPNALFDGAYYRSQVRGRKVEGDPLSDYLARGADAGLRPHPLFDPQFYQRQLNKPLPEAELLRHYLTVGWRIGISPHPLFDPEYYVATIGGGMPEMSPLVHYLMRDDYNSTPHYLFSDDVYTAAIEGRPSATNPGLKGLAPLVHYAIYGWKLRVQTHPLFDPAAYTAGHRKAIARHGLAHRDPGLEEEQDLLRHYVEDGWRLGISPSPYFDLEFYKGQVADLDPGTDPLRQYLMPGGYGAVSPHPGIDVEYYASEAGFFADDVPTILHLLATPVAQRVSPHPSFDATRYKAVYPDIANYPGGPILHFLEHGIEEDRAPSEWFSQDYVFNSFPQHDFGRESAVHHYLAAKLGTRPRLVFVSHDAGLTGAPGTILRIIQDFGRLYDIDSFAIVSGSGPRVPDFRRHAHTVFVHEPFYAAPKERLAEIAQQLVAMTRDNRPIAAIVNSAESRAMGAELARVGIPVITLVHESADLYPAGSFEPLVAASKKIVFGSQFVRDRAADHVDLKDDVALVRGQGLQQDFIGTMNREQARAAVLKELGLEKDCLLVLGCGSVDYRKGADLFTATAIDFIKKRPDLASRTCFVWVGKGPGTHSMVESFVASEIRSHRADSQIRFIGGRDDVEPYFVAADAFLMTSRVDPYPCVVQEAMAVALPVVAFTEGGGTVEMIGDEAGFCVPLGDTGAMADKVVRLADEPQLRRSLGQRGRRIVAERWRPADYCHDLADLVAEVSAFPLERRPASAPAAGTRKVFVLVSDWQVALPMERAEDIVRGLNRRGFDAELVLTRGRFTQSLSGGRAQRLPEVPYRFLQPANVAFEKGQWRTTVHEIWRSLRDLCRLHHPAVIVALDDELGASIGTALPASVGLVAALPPGEGAVEEIYGIGPLLDRIVALSPTGAAELAQRNPALASKTLALAPTSFQPMPEPVVEAARGTILVSTDLTDLLASRTILALRRELARLAPDARVLIHAPEPPQDASLHKLLRAAGAEAEEVLIGRPAADIQAALRSSSVALFLCRDASSQGLIVSAAAAGAVTVAVDPDKDVAGLVKAAGLGVVLPTRSVDAAVEAVLGLVTDPTSRPPYIAAGRRYLAENHESAEVLLAAMLAEVFDELAAKGSTRRIAIGTPPLDAVPMSRHFAGSQMRIPPI